MEYWKKIEDYEGYYISNLGRIVSEGGLRRFLPKFIKGRSDGNGYLKVVLYKNGKGKNFRIHRLVGIHFIPNPENKPEIDHINRIRNDNKMTNLRWATKSEQAYNRVYKR